MATSQMSEVIRHLRGAVLPRDGAGLTDGQLLKDYLGRRDEAALTALVRRHGPMVWGVCRRVLRDYHDAEDAFQATFLVLVRKAASIASPELLANWLYGVAHQTALNARATTAKRRARERQVTEMTEPAVTEQDLWADLQPLLDQELSRLPDMYRVAIVLCDLGGKTRKEAARQLGCPEGTLAARVARGRVMLAKRLARRGVVLSGGLLAAALARGAASACVPPAVVSSTIKAATVFAAGGAAASVVSAKAAALTEGVLKTMLLTKLRLTCALLLAATVIGTGFGLLARQGRAGDEKGAPVPATPQPATGGAKGPAPGAALKSLQQALQAAADIKDPEQKARALIGVAEAQTKAGEREAALKTLQQASQAARALPEDTEDGVYVRCVVLSMLAGAQAEAGDREAARKTAEAIRKPDVEGIVGPQVEGLRAHASAGIAAAQAKAGNYKEAAEIVGRIDDKFWWVKGGALVSLTAAQARAGEWKAAGETVKGIAMDTYRVQALTEIAKARAKAGQGAEARQSFDEALRVVNNFLMDRQGQEDRAHCLSHIARVQAETGDVKAALVTAESVPEILEKDSMGTVISFPFRERILVELQARAADTEAARKVAAVIDDQYQGGYQKGYALRVIAVAQARAKDVKGAVQTAEAIAHPFNQTSAYIEIAQSQAGGDDHVGATQTFAKARKLAEDVAEVKEQALLFRDLASAQAETGQEKAAGEWIAKQSSPNLKVWALVGLAEGIAKRQTANKTPR